MHVTTLLNENTNEQEDVLRLIKAIANSSQFFRQRKSDDEWLYRGLSYVRFPEGEIVREITPRTNRTPRDINSILHEALDNWFDAKFGIKYRSQGTFVTGSRRIAEEYGHGVIVLPQGPYQFCWGEDMTDALHEFDLHRAYQWMALSAREQGENIPYLKHSGFRPAGGVDAFVEFVSDSLLGPGLFEDWVDDTARRGKYKDTDLSEAIKSHNEIMLKCSSYAAVPINFTVEPEHIEAAEELLKMHLEIEYAPSMTQFVNALSKVYSRAL